MDKEIEDFRTRIEKEVGMSQVEEVIRNNEVVWEYKGVDYRIVAIPFKVRMESYDLKVNTYTKFLMEGKYKMESILKKIYLEQGVDIDELQNKYDVLEVEKATYLLRLGKLLEEKADVKDLETLKDEIETINSRMFRLSMEKINLTQYSLENQVAVTVYRWMASQVLEKKDGENWVKAFNTFDEFTAQPDEFLNRAIFNTTIIAGQI